MKVRDVPHVCLNCVCLSYTGIASIFHCEHDKAGIHPMYRTMTLGEAMGNKCKNCWKYSKPTEEMHKMHPNVKAFDRDYFVPYDIPDPEDD